MARGSLASFALDLKKMKQRCCGIDVALHAALFTNLGGGIMALCHTRWGQVVLMMDGIA